MIQHLSGCNKAPQGDELGPARTLDLPRDGDRTAGRVIAAGPEVLFTDQFDQWRLHAD